MSEQYVTLAEIRDLLDEENLKRELLGSQKAAMEHARIVSTLTVDQAQALVAEVKTIEGVTEYAAVKIADLLPQYPEDVRAIFSKERVTLDAPTISKIIEAVGKYL
jgi:DNA-directed RNA polymerase subunit F